MRLSSLLTFNQRYSQREKGKPTEFIICGVVVFLRMNEAVEKAPAFKPQNRSGIASARPESGSIKFYLT